MRGTCSVHLWAAFSSLVGTSWSHHIAVAEGAFSGVWEGHLRGSSDVSFPVAYDLTPLWRAFPVHRCWTADKQIQWQGALFLCLCNWSQCLWGSCWHMQLTRLPVTSKRQVLFGRRPPILSLASFGHSTGEAWWHSWQSSPLFSGSWHLPPHPRQRPHLA